MQIPHYSLILNVNAQKSTQAIIAKQYDDKSRYIDITLVADNKPIVLNKERVTLTAFDNKAKETIAVIDCTIVDGIIVAELTANILSVTTTLDCEVTVYGTKNEILTSARFNCIVDSKLSTEAVERTPEFSALQSALSDVASTSNRIDELSSRTQPINLGGTGATTTLEAANNLKSAYLGVSTAVPENSDLNSYMAVGSYDIAHAAIATLANSPFPDHSYKMYVVACTASSYVTQIAISPYYGNLCMRAYDSNAKVWTDWKKILSQPTTISEVGTWTPTINNVNFTFKSARYYYNGYTVTVEAILELSKENEATSYLSVGGLPIAISANGGGTAGSGYVYSSATAPCVATFSTQSKRVIIRSSENLAGKTVAIGLTYII